MKIGHKAITLSVLTAISASLCCITPVLAFAAGTAGVASSFLWIEPFRFHFIGLTVLILGVAWYQKLKPKKQEDCDCETEQKVKYIHSKTYLGLVTALAILMLSFPQYALVFYPKVGEKIVIVEKANIQTFEFKISGMTCAGCEEHVNQEVNKLAGILKSDVSYENGNALVQFDNSKTTANQIETAINSTGYNVTEKIKQ